MAGKLSDYEINRRLALVQTDLTGSTKPILNLFANNITPSESNVLGDFVEAGFNGYASANLDYSPSITGPVSNVYTITPPAIVFTSTGGGSNTNVYGYYVTDHTNTNLLWAERDPSAPLDMSINGATYTVTAKLTGTDA